MFSDQDALSHFSEEWESASQAARSSRVSSAPRRDTSSRGSTDLTRISDLSGSDLESDDDGAMF